MAGVHGDNEAYKHLLEQTEEEEEKGEENYDHLIEAVQMIAGRG